MRGIGWTVLYYDPAGNKLINTWIGEHDTGHLAGAAPILIMDVFEHAFMIDYGLKRADYIEAFFKAIDWTAAAKRFDAAATSTIIPLQSTRLAGRLPSPGAAWQACASIDVLQSIASNWIARRWPSSKRRQKPLRNLSRRFLRPILFLETRGNLVDLIFEFRVRQQAQGSASFPRSRYRAFNKCSHPVGCGFGGGGKALLHLPDHADHGLVLVHGNRCEPEQRKPGAQSRCRSLDVIPGFGASGVPARPHPASARRLRRSLR